MRNRRCVAPHVWQTDSSTRAARPDEFKLLIDEIDGYRRDYGRADAPFEYQAMSGDAFNPDGVKKLEDIGVAESIVAFRNPYDAEPDNRSLEDMIGQLHWFADNVIAKVG